MSAGCGGGQIHRLDVPRLPETGGAHRVPVTGGRHLPLPGVREPLVRDGAGHQAALEPCASPLICDALPSRTSAWMSKSPTWRRPLGLKAKVAPHGRSPARQFSAGRIPEALSQSRDRTPLAPGSWRKLQKQQPPTGLEAAQLLNRLAQPRRRSWLPWSASA